MKVEVPSSLSSPEELWTSMFNRICERIGPCFARSETRERDKAHSKGLLSPVERKNAWQLAEEAAFSTPDAVQYLLNGEVGDRPEERGQVHAYTNGVHGHA